MLKMLTLAGCFLLTAVVAGARLASPTEPEQADDKKPIDSGIVQRTKEPVPAGGPTISVRGVVVTSDGKPVSGAIVILRSKTMYFYAMGVPHSREMLARTTTDANGQFVFDKIGIPPRMNRDIELLSRGEGGAQLVTWADGLAVSWTEVKKLNNPAPIQLTLAPEAKVEGVVKDPSGTGVPGVRVIAWGLSRLMVDIDTTFLRADHLRLGACEQSLKDVFTDAGGHFTLHHLPHDLRIWVNFEKPGLGWQGRFLDTGNHGDLTEIKDRNQALPVLHSPMQVTLKPEQYVRVKVIDHKGQPVDDGCIEVIDTQRHGAGQGCLNERGETQITIAKPGQYEFMYGTDPLAPRLSTSVKAEIVAGKEPPPIEVRLPEPRWLSGRVLDADTGKPVIGAYLNYIREGEKHDIWSNAVSGVDGSFRIPVMSGSGSLGYLHEVFGYFPPTYGNVPGQSSRVPVNIPESGEPPALTLTIGRGLVIRGIVHNRDGKPAAGAVVSAENEGAPYHRSSAVTNQDGKFELAGLSPYARTVLLAQGESGVAEQKIPPTPKHPAGQTLHKDMELQLKEGVTLIGRVLYKDQPRAGVVMKLFRTLGKVEQQAPDASGRVMSSPFFSAGEFKTDAQGTYRVHGLQAGEQFYFEIHDKDGMVAPHWTYQSRYIQTVPAERREIQLPDIRLVSRVQTLRGVVVDPKGKPVKGVTVSAQLQGQSLMRPPTGPVPWTDTDAQGRFELLQLPDLPLELMAYLANPRGGVIHFHSTARPALNDQKIHIVLDPSLNQEIEDLDAKKPGTNKK